MPEGPEAKYLSLLLKKNIVGKTIQKLTSLSKIRPRLPDKTSKVTDVISTGKLITIITTNYFIDIHLGITGWININKEGNYTKYIIELNGLTVYVDSKRKLTKLLVNNSKKHATMVDVLGVDIFSPAFTLGIFNKMIKSNGINISALLLSQKIAFCGIGNYIRNESLYIARINPKRNSNTLDDMEIKKLYDAIRFISYSALFDWTKNNGTLPNNIKKQAPTKLEIPYTFRVYDQEKDPKGNKVTTEIIGSRRAFYVKSLQK